MKIRGNTVGVSNPRPDWKQEDAKKADFIKNKPEGELPQVTEADNGKFLRVVDGSWGLADLARAEEAKF